MNNRRLYITLFFVMALTLLLAIHNRFIQDDAFISFRYAQNLAEGKGLVFNIGERVEGYTNFLWTCLLSLSFLVKIDPVYFSWMMGLLLFRFLRPERLVNPDMFMSVAQYLAPGRIDFDIAILAKEKYLNSL